MVHIHWKILCYGCNINVCSHSKVIQSSWYDSEHEYNEPSLGSKSRARVHVNCDHTQISTQTPPHSPGSGMTLKELPFDIYVQILKQLPVSVRTNDGPRTLAACLRANTLLRRAASFSALWEPHYHAQYTISVPANELARKRAFGDDWKSLYVERVRLDRQATQILDAIIVERDGRLERAREVTSTLSYDVWNALATEAQCPVPEPFYNTHESRDGEVPRHAVPRRFWARSLMGAIARCHAVRTWSAIRDARGNDADMLETGIACLSSYFAHPPMEVRNESLYPCPRLMMWLRTDFVSTRCSWRALSVVSCH